MPVLNIQSVLSSSAAFNAGIPVLVPFGSNNTAGNTIVVYISEQNGPPANFVVIDSQGNTYTQVGTYADYGPDARRTGIFSARNIKVGPNTVSITPDQSSFGFNIIIAEYSGNPTVVPITSSASLVTTAGSTIAVNLTTTNPNDLVALLFYQATTSTVSPPAGFTLRQATSGLGLAPNATVFDSAAYWDMGIPTPGTAAYTISNVAHGVHPEVILWGVVLTTGPVPRGRCYVFEM